MKQIISKSFFFITLVSIFAIVFSSCSTSESVVNNGFLQKRKYNKGFHKSIKKNHKKQSVQEKEVLVYNETEVVKIEKVNAIKEVAEKSNFTAVVRENNQTEEVAVVTLKENNSIKEEAPVKEHKAIEKLSNTVAKVKTKVSKETIINNSSSNTTNTTDDMMILLIILAILLPFVAVGIYTDWDVTKVLIAVLLSLLFWLPGIIYALLVINDMA